MTSSPRLRRVFAVAFAAGFLVLVPSTMLALALPSFEPVAPLLRPGVLLLRPWAEALAGWPGAVNLLVASLANGLVVGAVAVAVAAVLGRLRGPA